MKKTLIIIVALFFFSAFSYAQDYNTGIGVRGGPANGLTVKSFIGERAAFEGIVATRWRGFNFTALYEMHHPAFNAERLKFYYGLGGHVGFWNDNEPYWADEPGPYTVIGVDGILGLEFSFREIPFNISLDWKPAFNLTGYSGFWVDEGAISIRYIF